MDLKDESIAETPDELVKNSLGGPHPISWVRIPRGVAREVMFFLTHSSQPIFRPLALVHSQTLGKPWPVPSAGLEPSTYSVIGHTWTWLMMDQSVAPQWTRFLDPSLISCFLLQGPDFPKSMLAFVLKQKRANHVALFCLRVFHTNVKSGFGFAFFFFL